MFHSSQVPDKQTAIRSFVSITEQQTSHLSVVAIASGRTFTEAQLDYDQSRFLQCTLLNIFRTSISNPSSSED